MTSRPPLYTTWWLPYEEGRPLTKKPLICLDHTDLRDAIEVLAKKINAGKAHEFVRCVATYHATVGADSDILHRQVNIIPAAEEIAADGASETADDLSDRGLTPRRHRPTTSSDYGWAA